MTFRKVMETKIIRTRYEIDVRASRDFGTTAKRISEHLASVPGKAKLIAVDDRDGTNKVTLVFQSEEQKNE